MHSLHILDTAAEERFDRYTQLVADVFDFPVGVSFYPEHGSKPVALLEKACAAIHTREAGVTATARHYSPAHALHVSQRLHMETRLRRGLEEDSFRFEYQPIVSLADGRMGAVEALMRWDDDEVEDTSPSLFIPLAEQSGLILPLGSGRSRK